MQQIWLSKSDRGLPQIDVTQCSDSVPPRPQLVRHLLLFFDKNRTSPRCCNIIINISIEQYHCHAHPCQKDGVIVLDVGNGTFEQQVSRNMVAEIRYSLIGSLFLTITKSRETHPARRVVIEVHSKTK